MARNVYQTKNYFIAAYHYVQCYGTDLVVPSSTAEVAQAMAHYHKRAQVCSSRALQQRLAKPSAQLGLLLSISVSATQQVVCDLWQRHKTGACGVAGWRCRCPQMVCMCGHSLQLVSQLQRLAFKLQPKGKRPGRAPALQTLPGHSRQRPPTVTCSSSSSSSSAATQDLKSCQLTTYVWHWAYPSAQETQPLDIALS
jgi:hypothetical protein